MIAAIIIVTLLSVGVLIWAIVNAAPHPETTEEEKAQIREILRSQEDLSP